MAYYTHEGSKKSLFIFTLNVSVRLNRTRRGNAMRFSIVTLSILFSLTIVSIASAEVIAKCGPLKGYAYWVPSPMVPKDEVGWDTDSISSTKMLIKNGKDYDIRFRTMTGSVSSTREQGGEVFKVKQSSSSITLLALYSGATTEVYTYNYQTRVLSYFADKLGGVIPSLKLLIGPCTD